MEKLKDLLFRQYATLLFILGMMLVSGLCLYLGFTYFIEFSAFAVVLAMVTVVITLFVLIDKCVLPGINTLEELSNGNVAVAIMLLAIAVLIHACVQFI